MNQMYELMSKHVSIRKYKDEDIKEEDLNEILKSAQFAPSSINGQQWIEETPVFLLFVADYYRAPMLGTIKRSIYRNYGKYFFLFKSYIILKVHLQ